MSGSGSTFGGFDSGAQDCNTLTIRTKLASPDRAVIDEINIGDVLKVILTPPSGPINIITTDNKIAGAVLPMDLESLIQCISEGHEYEAKVTEINMGNCEVLIKHK